MSRKKPSPVSGVLVLDKPAGCTSHDVVNRVRRLYGTTQVGHTGTLDPMATGVLPILIGRAVKAADFVLAEDKTYEAVLRLGLTTDTEDVTGQVLTRSEIIPGEDAVLTAIAGMRGEQQQTPPMYSALKVGGQKLCDLARAGREVERASRTITVYDIRGERLTAETYRLTVRCSKGTYIRTLCADIGRALGCGGVMDALRRLATGGFTLADAITPEALEALSPEERLRLPRPVESLFRDCPALRLPPFYERLFRSGCEIYLAKLGVSLPDGALVRVLAGDGFIALGRVGAYPDGSAVKSEKLFVL